MKKILIQLDSDPYASTFDSIVAYDAGADVVQSYGGVRPADVRGLILSACFTRGIPDLHTIAVWIGGSDAYVGEQLLTEARKTFFGPFKISLMLDSNGCNTTASTAVAKLARQTDLKGKAAFVIGPGPVGMRAAALLAGEGCRVHLASIPPQLLGERFNRTMANYTLESARKISANFPGSAASAAGGSLEVVDATDPGMIETHLSQAEIGVAAGPEGLCILPETVWSKAPGLKWMLDFNLTDPLGIEGIKPGDDFVEYGHCRASGALAIGNPKMKLHKACIAQLFDRNDLVLDAEGVYRIAKEMI